MTGLLQHRWPDGLLYHEFRYNVVRTWERPADEILAGGLATLPLAPLAKVKENELPAVIQAMRQRLDREATRGQAGMLWTATYVLMGLTYSDELIDRLLEGVQSMKESVTYQKILREGLAKGLVEGRAEGRVEGARRDELRDVSRDARRKRGEFSGDKEPGDLESRTLTSRPRLMPSRIWSDSSSCQTASSR